MECEIDCNKLRAHQLRLHTFGFTARLTSFPFRFSKVTVIGENGVYVQIINKKYTIKTNGTKLKLQTLILILSTGDVNMTDVTLCHR